MKTVTSLEENDAFVIGARIYMGSVIDTNKFVGKFHDMLAKRPVAAFAVGIAHASPDVTKWEESRKALDTSLARINPVAVTLFAGMLDPGKLSFIPRKMTEFVKSPTGDFRDWNAIAAWARELPALMKR